MTDDAYSAGENVARYRYRRQLTQEQLAERAGVSLSTVKSIERGARAGRMATLNRLARALQTTTSDLLAPERGATPTRVGPPDGLLAVRRVLSPPLGLAEAAGPPASARAFAASLAYTERLYHDDNYDLVLDAVPVLVEEGRALHAAGEPMPLAQAYMTAGQVLTQVRQLDLANHALHLAHGVAAELGDEVLAAWVVTIQCWTLLLDRRFPEVERLALATAETIEPAMSDPASNRTGTWGWLMARASAAAVRDAKTDAAADYMAQARAAAARLGEHAPDMWMPPPIGGFCETTVAFKEVENAVILGETGRALERAEHIAPSTVPTMNNRMRHRLDLAAAHLAEHDTDAAVEELLSVREAVPEWLAHQGYARGLVRQLVETRRRAYADEVGLLADHVGIAI